MREDDRQNQYIYIYILYIFFYCNSKYIVREDTTRKKCNWDILILDTLEIEYVVKYLNDIDI